MYILAYVDAFLADPLTISFSLYVIWLTISMSLFALNASVRLVVLYFCYDFIQPDFPCFRWGFLFRQHIYIYIYISGWSTFTPYFKFHTYVREVRLCFGISYVCCFALFGPWFYILGVFCFKVVCGIMIIQLSLSWIYVYMIGIYVAHIATWSVYVHVCASRSILICVD